ncbi:4-hydroxy-tetrahydrodipicolinate reductase [Natronolimnobius sp. AArcel1]|uniref:4-hydroxy-tetrahydrodipicolinate reductase n=1 Tax=Natronolimnobius sp. AArcel1 TaxID=1679093 RepID=UPI0013ED455B|nr:4-hydroxy-tetrahydrodipicolinate reductase [Natronolimnobius sp. AArcel1]NGM69887.1 4-hydroxy-tetrahydrodipicolinate reductase [Natronolimnobius sp. AArcel1]
MTVRIGVTGATGRMGQEVIAAVDKHDDCEVAFAVNRDPDGATVDGIAVEPAREFADLVHEYEPTAVIDFTGPDSALEYAQACANAGVAFVTGTTGFDDDQREHLEATSEATPLLHAPNFARGVQALVNVVGDAVQDLAGYDVELVETHHNQKRDAPSGTANRLLEEIEANGDFSGRKHGREGFDPREEGEIGVHVLRAGNVTGEHEIVIADNHEEVRLTHRAEDRGVFAAGAVDAAVWLADREPGSYDFADVLAD